MDLNDLVGYTSLIASLLAVGLAIFLFRHSGSEAIERLRILLIAEAVDVMSSGAGISKLIEFDPLWPDIIYISIAICHDLADLLILWLYPIFVAYALPNNLTNWIRGAWGRAALGLVVVSIALLCISIGSKKPIYTMMVLMYSFVFISALYSMARAKTELTRAKAKLFAIAFGIRDITWAVAFLTLALEFDTYQSYFLLLYAVSMALYVPLVTYGVLRQQMLDIDLHLKTTIKGSTLAAIFLALYFLISEGISTFFTEWLGSFLGIAVAALLIFLLAPLHRWAEWVSSAMVPNKLENEDYKTYRKFQMYSSGIEEAMAIGEVTQSQFALLDILRESLQLSKNDSEQLETDLGLVRN